jgi:2-keto-3-deoxy-galactonokinase
LGTVIGVIVILGGIIALIGLIIVGFSQIPALVWEIAAGVFIGGLLLRL